MVGRTKEVVFADDRMLDLPDLPGNDELKNPGLHPRVRLFVSNLLTGYLRYAPMRINALVSAYAMLGENQNGRSNMRHTIADLPFARTLFLDSGAITPLLLCSRGKAKPDQLMAWLERTNDVVDLAWLLEANGVAEGVVAAMDLPGYASLLATAGLTVPQAEAITLRNAETMLAAELPPRWLPVFTSQGVSLEDHQRCLDGYERLGVLAAVREGRAWLAVGGMAFEGETTRIHAVHRYVRERLGAGHVHALGVSRLHALVPMVHRGWVNSADSSSPAQEIRYNRGPYRVTGPRPAFVWEALHAASALYYEAELATALARAARLPDHEQHEAFPFSSSDEVGA